MSKHLLAIAALMPLFAAAPALAQFDFTQMDIGAMHRQMAAQQQMQEEAMARAIVRRNLNDPRVQAMYRQHRANGGRMTPEQFAFDYADKGGYSPEGMARYRQSQADIAARDAAAVRGLRAAEAQRGAAQTEMFERFYEGQAERGTMLGGRSTYVDPRDGRQYYLPHTLQPNTGYHDHGSGRDFWFGDDGYEFADE